MYQSYDILWSFFISPFAFVYLLSSLSFLYPTMSTEQELTAPPVHVSPQPYPIPVASDKVGITEEDIKELFPALRKLKITKDDAGIANTVEKSQYAFIAARLAFNQQWQDLMSKEVDEKPVNGKKGQSRHHPSHKSRQDLFDALQTLTRSHAEYRSKMVIIQGLILQEKQRIEGLYSGLLLKAQNRLIKSEQTMLVYEAFHKCRINGSLANVGYDVETDLTHSMHGQERVNTRILIPLETKKKVLDHIVARYKETDWTKPIVLGGQEWEWCNIIVSWLKRDIANYKNSTADYTDWRRVYQLYELHNDLESFPDCKELALQLRPEWLNDEVTHSIHSTRVQEERRRQAYKEEQERLARESSSSSSSSVPIPTPTPTPSTQ
jgi:hypothetical protein